MSQCPSFKAKDVVRIIRDYRWHSHDQTGSHEQFTHPDLKGKITVERHASKDLPFEIVKSIFKQAGMEHFLKMFREGVHHKAIEKAIKAEARERFDAPAAATPAGLQPRPEMA